MKKILIAFCLAYLLLSLPAFFQKTHFLQNLEPYPDGLLYALSARNFAHGEGLDLEYLDSSIEFWVPPAYAYTLSLGYLVNTSPEIFYAANVLLGLGALWLLLRLVEQTTKSKLSVAVAGLVYLAHAFVLWLPSVPMAENLALCLFVVVLTQLFKKERSWKSFAIGLFAVILLVATKFSVIIIAVALCLWLVTNFGKQLKKYWLQVLGLATFGLAVLFLLLPTNPLTIFTNFYNSLASGTNQFYSFHFVGTNITTYFDMLAGRGGAFLWQHIPLSSIGMLLIFVVCAGLYLYSKNAEIRRRGWILLTLFLAQFPLMLVFYVADARYIIFSIPLIALSAGWLAKLLPRSVIFILIALALQAVVQLPLLKQIVSANLLGRSVGWQHESILAFDNVVPKDAYIITALPSFLVDAYSTSTYRVLPLSNQQEFLQKKQWVWGSDLEPELFPVNLSTIFDKLLEQGKEVYISNAYITHSAKVVADYETLQELYQTKLVQEGCLGACNVYLVKSL